MHNLKNRNSNRVLHIKTIFYYFYRIVSIQEEFYWRNKNRHIQQMYYLFVFLQFHYVINFYYH